METVWRDCLNSWLYAQQSAACTTTTFKTDIDVLVGPGRQRYDVETVMLTRRTDNLVLIGISKKVKTHDLGFVRNTKRLKFCLEKRDKS